MIAIIERRKCMETYPELLVDPIVYQNFLIIKNLATQEKRELGAFPRPWHISLIDSQIQH